MISRVAESCFWLSRYLERAESTARLLGVNQTFILDIELPEIDRWYPMIVVAGEKERFNKLYEGEDRRNGETVQTYMTWDERNPVSIRSSLFWARENARTIREVISLDMWESLNYTWHWLTSGQGKRAFKSNRDKFYRHIINSVNVFHGVSDNTMSHERPYDFMRLGTHLERAGQTARILDMKYHTIGPTKPGMESPIEIAQWFALLRSCSASDAYLKSLRSGISGITIFEFLIKDDSFPRSVQHCCSRALNFMHRIKPEHSAIGNQSLAEMEVLASHIKNSTTQELVHKGVHKELTYIVDCTTDICAAIKEDYFEPKLPAEFDCA